MAVAIGDAPPSSPPLPPTRPILSRKRTRASELSISCPSSDPAFFSSDDLNDEGVENYNSDRPRKKVQWNGNWWGARDEPITSSLTRQTTGTTRKNTFTRNMDSGVWMASDDSEATIPDSDPIALPEVTNTCERNTPKRSAMEDLITKRIMDAVEQQSVRIDLSDLQLDFLDGELLAPLRTVTAPARHLDAAGSSSPIDYAPLIPYLQIFLSNNRLTRLPSGLTHFEHLTVLSLRNNNLMELPSSISKLPYLRELYISGNRLRYLPSSMLGEWWGNRSQRRPIGLWSNPIINPITEHPEQKEQLPNESSSTRNSGDRVPGPGPMTLHPLARALLDVGAKARAWKDIYPRRGSNPWREPFVVASTPVVYYDTNGSPLVGRPISEMTSEQIIASLWDKPPPPVLPTRTTSLFQQCLRLCSQSSDLPKLAGLMPPDTAPTVMAGIDAAVVCVEEGGRDCSTCGKSYVFPRAEWIAFMGCLSESDSMHPGTEGPFLPFIHRVCSWACCKAE